MKPALRQLCCLLLLSLAVLTTKSNAKPGKPVSPPPPIDFSELDRLVVEELKEKNTPGAVITVVSGDQVVYQKAFGVANVETNAPMQAEMLFRLGSTTKMFTAAALVTLAENNKIKMNEPIGQRIKGLNAKVANVTPHYLLSNSAGVRPHIHFRISAAGFRTAAATYFTRSDKPSAHLVLVLTPAR